MKKLLIIFLALSISQISNAQRTKGEAGPPRKTRTATSSTGVGVNINLGSVLHAFKRKCNQVKVVYPKPNSSVKSGLTNAPVFRWRSTKSKFVKSYKVGLAILNGKEKTMLFQGDINGTQMAWPKNVAWQAATKGKKTYQFFVMALMKKGSKCKNTVVSSKFIVITKKPLIVKNQQNNLQDKTLSKSDAGNALNAIHITKKVVTKDDTTNSDSGSETARGRRKARKACVNSGGSFWESSDGSYMCMKELSIAEGDTNISPDSLLQSRKRKCWKAGGQWVTNSHGSFCFASKSDAGNALNAVKGGSDTNINKRAIMEPGVKEKPIKKKATRTGRNPQTGATIKVQGLLKSDAGNTPRPKSKGTVKFFNATKIGVIEPDTLRQSKGTVKFFNATRIGVIEPDIKEQQLKLINLFPKNNANFRSLDNIKEFKWQLVGNKIPNPKYVIEIVKIGKNNQPQKSYIAKTTNTSISSSEMFRDKKLSYGQYRWKVTETTTGISSSYSYFSSSNCRINFTIANETIECLGYVGGDRKFKICFDSYYASPDGDLTYTPSSGSGLTVYDQTYSPLPHSLLTPLVTQYGSLPSTENYCFEVTVPGSVTSIDFRLQGDDINPSPTTGCIPGVDLMIDELPSCICNDCDRIQTKLTDIKITPKDSLGNQYNISGNISVNVPIYGLEFQVQSYSYSASPNSCSQGVNSIEQSGMILMPATTVNGSTNLQLFNETISGSSTTNNHATKVIKYNSSTPLTGLIPVNLTIGLPGPLAGLNAGCCKMSYQVCIKVIIYYDKDSCKSCVITKCFNFNNQ